MIRSLITSCAIVALAGCMSKSASEVRHLPMTTEQGKQDLQQLVNIAKDMYGPLRYKEERFGYSIDDLAAQSMAQMDKATSDEEIHAVLVKFLDNFMDGHVSIRFPSYGTATPTDKLVLAYKAPVFLTPVGDKIVVGDVKEDVADQIKKGDVVTHIDGRPVEELMKIVNQYGSSGNEVSDRHNAYKMLNRPYYMTDLKPTSPGVALTLVDAEGKTYERELFWKEVEVFPSTYEKPASASAYQNIIEKGFTYGGLASYNAAAEGSRLEMGADKPFFVTEATEGTFREVAANAAYLEKYGVPADHIPPIYAALYSHKGKTILLVRQAGYSPDEGFTPEDFMKHYKAILDQYEPLADILVIDQNHNPGGYLNYVLDFFQLFVHESANGFVQYMKADSTWINDFKSWQQELDPASQMFERAKYAINEIERANYAGKFLTEKPIPLDGNTIVLKGDYTWKKPVMVLADELSGSCGDIFPMLMQRNNIAKVFGERTMGLGGNVVQVPLLTHSHAKIRMTRGLFTTFRPDGNYTKDDIVENNGVTPDFRYQHSVDDFRAGFTAYVEAFSDKAIEILEEANRPAGVNPNPIISL
jgi:C-terminal processing protease CtpA/Prc